MYNITFQQIETFLTVAEYLNFSKAAEAMFISQPSLSKTLQRLEEGVRVKLFTRSNQGVALTREGEYLYSALEPLYNNMDKAFKTAQSIASAPIKTLHIVEPSGYDTTEGYEQLKSAVRQYERQYPDVAVQESLCDFRDLRRQLEFGDADIVISPSFAILDIKNIEVRWLSEFKLYIAMSATHPLAGRDEMRLEWLRDETFYMVPHTGAPADRYLLLEYCRQMNFTPKSVEYSMNFQTLLHLLQSNRGVSICERFKYANTEGIRYFPIIPPEQPAYIAVAWRKGTLTRETQSYINLLPDGVDPADEL
ncbi:MAG: LysR family transcriptional regulator [Oscillospiraceae bacterium]|jgi:DNA-binding transcriptional LysR family regulator|nr:LysR family transcriptional regulator [Oscillospiraceae bacterium]